MRRLHSLRFWSAATNPLTDRASPGRQVPGPLVILLVALAIISLVACNPFAGDEEDGLEQSLEASAQGAESNLPRETDGQSTSAATGESAAGAMEEEPPPAPEPTPEPAPPAPQEGQEAAEEATPPEEAPPVFAIQTVEEARDLVWSQLSQCISLDATELESYQIQDNYFVRASGEEPDKYGIWRVEGVSGEISPHNIRAREWAPLINPQCNQETVAQMLGTAPTQPPATAVADGEQAITVLWSNLVKCYSAVSREDFQAVPNPTDVEWIITAKEGVESNFGVWRVGGDGSIIPDNVQANALYGQVSSGLC